MTKYYKIVDKDNKSINDRHKIQYMENYWVSPKIAGSQLFVFDCIDSVIKFCDNFCAYKSLIRDDKIYEVEVRSIYKQPLFMCPGLFKPNLLEIIAKRRMRKQKFKYLLEDTFTHIKQPPLGTVAVGQIMLTRFVCDTYKLNYLSQVFK